MSVYGDYIKSIVRTVRGWPQPGVNFRDITPILQNRSAFRKLVDSFVHRYHDMEFDVVAAIDARGLIIGAPIAYELNCSFVPIRKEGKLPFDTLREPYTLEYGQASVEMHQDAVRRGDRVLLVDDLIATGGTMLASSRLIERAGGTVVEAAAIIHLSDLGGMKRLQDAGLPVFTLCSFTEDE
ncbi:MAG: adenine phosphoribosyltransferase [Burkholderiales bacterium]|nr:adenine phosphoribosyltransferase [Burkholderiales bacterium]PZN06314.1 MAG: adenine phosphoribosyltransferase [Pseudomonadota bacterium]